MAAWWDRNKNIDMQGFTRVEIEDYTGRLPLLLESCKDGGASNPNAPEVETITQQACQFLDKMKQGQSDRQWAR